MIRAVLLAILAFAAFGIILTIVSIAKADTNTPALCDISPPPGGCLHGVPHFGVPHEGMPWPIGPCFTHSGPDYLDGLVANALDEWGQTSAVCDAGAGDDIVIHYDDGSGGLGTWSAWALVNEDGKCEIGVREAGFLVYPPLWLIIHEVGHCLGFGHISDGYPASIMRGSNLGIRPYDRWAISQAYPDGQDYGLTLNRAVVPGLTSAP